MKQVKLAVEPRTNTGKGAAGRLRKTGRVPGVIYGYEVEASAVSIDALELYHALHTGAGTNVLLSVPLDGEDKLCVARDIQRHPVRGDVTHVDLLSVDKDAQIVVEVPINVEGIVEGDGVVNQVLGTVAINVAPLDTPNSFSLDVTGMEIGDTLRVEALADQLPEGATLAVDPDRTVVTVNPPEIIEVEEDEDVLDEFAGEGEELLEGEEGERPEGEEGERPADAEAAEATEEG